MEEYAASNLPIVKEILAQEEIKDVETLRPVVVALDQLKFSAFAAEILDAIAVSARRGNCIDL